MPARGLPSLGPPVDRPPAAHDPLDVGGRARAPHREQASFRLRRGHAGEGADLGVGQLPAGEGLGEERQRPEGARDPHPFTGGAQIEPDPPAQPGGAGAEARVPPAAGVELADQGEEARGGGVEMCGQLGDLVAELVQLCGEMLNGRWRMNLAWRALLLVEDSTPRISGGRRVARRGDRTTRNDSRSGRARPRIRWTYARCWTRDSVSAATAATDPPGKPVKRKSVRTAHARAAAVAMVELSPSATWSAGR